MKTTITEICVHPQDEHPTLSDLSTQISLVDPDYIKISQYNGSIRLSFEEFDYLVEAINKLRDQ